jgi:Peptidase M15
MGDYTRADTVAATDVQLSEASAVPLTAHFTLAEFFVHEIPPDDVITDKLPAMAALAEWFRTNIVGGPVDVKSYFRSSAHNADVGGADDSPHMTGDGADLVPMLNPGFDLLARRVTAAIAAGTAPAFGSMIFYKDEGHIHLSADGVPHGDHFVMFVSPTKEDGAPRIYLAFTSYAQFLQLWNGTSGGGKAAIGALLVVAILFSLDII